MDRIMEISVDGKTWHAVIRNQHDRAPVGFRIRLEVTHTQCVATPQAGQALHVIVDRVLRSTGRVCTRHGWSAAGGSRWKGCFENRSQDVPRD